MSKKRASQSYSSSSSSSLSVFSSFIDKTRCLFLPWVISGMPTVASFQQLCGVKFLPSNDSSTNTNGIHQPIPSSSTTRLRGSSISSISPAPAPSPRLITPSDSPRSSSDSTPASFLHDIPERSSINHIITNRFFYYYFSAAAAVGNEAFYIVFLPTLFWVVSYPLARRIISLWMSVYFIGQAVKDLLKLPRPYQSKVAQIENHYSAEYGLPSTHAMISFALPFYILILFISYDIVTPSLFYSSLISDPIVLIGFLLCAFITISVCLSRLYMGVHTPADIITGLLLGIILLLIFPRFGPGIDYWITTNYYSVIFIPIISLLLISIYPAPAKWTNAYGDTALIISVWNGVNLVSTPFFQGQQLFANLSLSWSSFSFSLLFFAIARVIVGTICLLLTRLIVKNICMFLASLILKFLKYPKIDMARTYSIEIPVKIFTYSAIGFNATYTIFLLFKFLKI